MLRMGRRYFCLPESARRGAKVELPFRPKGVKRPIDLWLGGK